MSRMCAWASTSVRWRAVARDRWQSWSCCWRAVAGSAEGPWEKGLGRSPPPPWECQSGPPCRRRDHPGEDDVAPH
eukprot:6365919-Prorocentrum_lima.AAC.1